MNMKEKWIKSAIPIYGCAALWLLLGIICPRMLLKLWFLVLAAALSAAVYWGLSKIFKPRKIEVRAAANSGDKTIDALIEEGHASLDRLAHANAEIPNADISANLDRMIHAGEEILNYLEKHTSQAHAVRRFMNYYLPTADKLMRSYRAMMQAENPGENIAQAMRSVENSLDMIANAFEKQLDKLFSDQKLDIETDIEVLETMMAGDGLIANEGTAQADQTAQAGN